MSHTLAQLGILVTVLLTAAIAYKAWQNRPKRGATWLAAFMALGAVLQVMNLVARYTPDQVDRLLLRVGWIGLALLPFLTVGFVLAYVGRDDLLTRRTCLALFAWPAGLNVVLWVPVVTDAVGSPVGAGVVEQFLAESGALFWSHVALGLGLLIVSTVLVVWHITRTNKLFTFQGAMVVFGILALWTGTVLQVLGYFEESAVTPFQLGFSILGASFFLGVFFGDATDVVPVVRSRILDTVAVGVLVVDQEERITEFNPHARDLLGVDPDRDVLGQPIETVLSDRPDFRDAIETLDDDSREFELQAPDGPRTVEVDVSPLRDRTGNRIGSGVLLYDVTSQRRRQRELERQNEQLEQFASLVSHDLRNPLAVANGHLFNAKRLADGEELLATLEEIERSHDRMEALTEDVLTLAREGRTVTDPGTVDVRLVARDAWEQVDTDDATLDVDTHERITADRSRLLRLFENLFRNSVEHGVADDTDPVTHDGGDPGAAGSPVTHDGGNAGTPDDGDPRAHDDGIPGSAEDDRSITIRVGDLPDGGLFVKDDGQGIPEDKRDKVLEDGYTTASDGTGLGLSIVTSIVEAHGWGIDVTESDAGGARFEIRTTTAAEADPPVPEA